MKVIKFGGTSLGSPERMQNLVQLLDFSTKQIIVLSAVAGTTNSLLRISETLFKKKSEQANELIDLLEENYRSTSSINNFCQDIISHNTNQITKNIKTIKDIWTGEIHELVAEYNKWLSFENGRKVSSKDKKAKKVVKK